LERDDASGTWYEYVYDDRSKSFTWVILPPDD